MAEFHLYTVLIAAIAGAGLVWGIRRDVLHPLVILMPMVVYTYVILPYELVYNNLTAVFTPDNWAHAQLINMICIAALAGGCLLATGSVANTPRPSKESFQPRPVERAFRFALFLGGCSLLAFTININNVGGLFEAYETVKGGGTAESGYLRDAILLGLPAIAILGYCVANDSLQPRYWVPAVVFALPLVVHGLFGARRGPTFLITAVLVTTWLLAHRRRPNPLMFLAGGVGLGLLLLAIVTFREQFRFGSELMKDTVGTVEEMAEEFGERRADSMDRTLGGNEFVYGTNVILTFEEKQDYFWGTRLLTIMFIRPIPKQFWPTKYADVGMERYTVNVGLGFVEEMFMWATVGAAPGFVADMFAEFSWGAVIVAFLVGLGFATAWRGAVYGNGIAMVIYVLLAGLSIFLVLQSMEAILSRLLFTLAPVVVAWRWLFADRSKRLGESNQLESNARRSR